VPNEFECTCELVDITDWADRAAGERRYVRGDPGDCPVHHTPASLARKAARDAGEAEHRRRREEAERRARLA
jgi:hypothetical protein